ncbi:MAG: N-acetylmuramoyl-L-alanine amidase [Chloroflexi bacterium]|nr:N-acetylmuramoyl-L-alanine amidase [Chloroflexota bacterium]
MRSVLAHILTNAIVSSARKRGAGPNSVFALSPWAVALVITILACQPTAQPPVGAIFTPSTPSPSTDPARERPTGGEVAGKPDLSPLPAVPELSPTQGGGWPLPLSVSDPAQGRRPGGEVGTPSPSTETSRGEVTPTPVVEEARQQPATASGRPTLAPTIDAPATLAGPAVVGDRVSALAEMPATVGANLTPDVSKPRPSDPLSASGPGSGAAGGLPAAAMPAERANTRLAPAGAVSPKVVALDPGHGGDEIGAVSVDDGPPLQEKAINLDIALRAERLLIARDYRVVLTRRADQSVNAERLDLNGDGQVNGADDLQARVDLANAAGADLFLSIHNNGSNDPTQSGTEVWYNSSRPFAEQNLRVARLLYTSLLRQLRSAGYSPVERGLKDDANFRIFRGVAYGIFVLSDARPPRHVRATNSPGALGESLFLSHRTEAQLLRREPTRQAIAAAYVEAVAAFFSGK